ncbi:MAG: TIGR00180 family glycosyltransferase [Ruegeria sp.]
MTVLVVTLNRHEKLPVMIEYVANVLGLNLIICDGTKNAAAPEISQSPGVTYMHLPGKSVMARLAAGAAGCETPFCLLSADDDFPLLDGVADCVAALKAIPSATVAAGTFYQYRIHARDQLEIKLVYLTNYLRNIRPRGAPRDTVGRMEYFARNFMQLIWAVHRTNNLRRFSAACVRFKAEETYLFEGSLSCGMALQGEYLAIPRAACIRDPMPRKSDPLARPQRHVFSSVPSVKQTYRATMDALDACCDVDLEQINATTSYPMHFNSTQDWFDAQFRDRSLADIRLPPTAVKLNIAKHSIQNLDLQVTLEDGLLVGDVDTTLETFLPVLQRIRSQFTDDNIFDKRFGRNVRSAMAKDQEIAAAQPNKTKSAKKDKSRGNGRSILRRLF